MKKVYGEFLNVKLTDEELMKLKERFSDYEEKINDLSFYIESKGDKYKSHYATILNWNRHDKKDLAKKSRFNNFIQKPTDYEDVEKKALGRLLKYSTQEG